MEGHQKKALKSVFEYNNYREFLKDFYSFSKAKKRGFSFRVFARMGGFKAGNILKLVMDGERNLAPEGVEKFCKALALNKQESQFFKNLVFLNQATSLGEKQIFAEEILKSRSYKKVHPLKQIQYELFAKWYLTVIREMVTISEFQEDPEWIASQLAPAISPYEAKKALEDLLKIGLLKRNEAGKLIQADPNIGTPDEVTSSAASFFHKEMMKRAAESIERVARENRELTSLTFGVSQDTAKRLKEMLQQFRENVVEAISNDAGTHESVYQLSCYLFPLVGSRGSEKK